MPRKSLVPLTALAAFGVAIDDQGHVINLCGTWANCPHGMQRPDGGNGAVVVFGIAAPVAAPLIGPPV
jgi:hypothetical protein